MITPLWTIIAIIASALSLLVIIPLEAAYVLFTLKIINGSVPDATTITT